MKSGAFFLVKTYFCHPFCSPGKTTRGEKVCNLSKNVKSDYVNCHSFKVLSSLWKTAVDKPVENVEKLGFSTGKPVIQDFVPPKKQVDFYNYVPP